MVSQQVLRGLAGALIALALGTRFPLGGVRPALAGASRLVVLGQPEPPSAEIPAGWHTFGTALARALGATWLGVHRLTAGQSSTLPAGQVAAAMKSAGADGAALLAPGRGISAWQLRPDGSAELLGLSSEADAEDHPLEAARLVARLWQPARQSGPPGRQRPGLDPTRPLLTEARAPARQPRSTATPWWVYATIGVAAGLAATIMVAHELGEDRQRIELVEP